MLLHSICLAKYRQCTMQRGGMYIVKEILELLNGCIILFFTTVRCSTLQRYSFSSNSGHSLISVAFFLLPHYMLCMHMAKLLIIPSNPANTDMEISYLTFFVAVNHLWWMFYYSHVIHLVVDICSMIDKILPYKIYRGGVNTKYVL